MYLPFSQAICASQDSEEVDEMNIIHNDYDVVSDIDPVSWLRLIFPFCLAQFANGKYYVCEL